MRGAATAAAVEVARSARASADWELSGYAEQVKLLLAVGYRVAQADKFPEWKPGNEFKIVRDKMLKKY